MPCNSRKGLVSGNTKYSTGFASEIWQEAPPCMVSVKRTEQSDIWRTTVTYVYKIPLCLYTFVHWNHLCCPHSFSLASCWTGAVSRGTQGWGCIIGWNVSFWSPGTYEHFRSIHNNRTQSCAVGQMTLHQMASTKQPAMAHPIASYCSSPVLFVKGSVVQHFFMQNPTVENVAHLYYILNSIRYSLAIFGTKYAISAQKSIQKQLMYLFRFPIVLPTPKTEVFRISW